MITIDEKKCPSCGLCQTGVPCESKVPVKEQILGNRLERNSSFWQREGRGDFRRL